MGLAAAYHLAKAGHRPVVLEKEDQVGGMSASFDFDGIRLEKYYHFINKPDQDLFALLRELDMEKDLRWTDTQMGFFRPEGRHAQGKGRLYPWGNPLALLRFPHASLVTRLRYGFHALYCKYMQNLMPLDDISAAQWIRKWEGEEGYDVLWRMLFEKKFYELSEPLSAAWIASRVRRVARSRKSLMREQLGYLEGGSDSLVHRMVEEIHNMGGTVHTGSPVQTVARQDEKFLLRLASEAHVGGAGSTLSTDALISTIPLPYVKRLFPFLPEAYAQRVGKVRNIAVACALFRLQKSVTNNFWLNIDMPSWDVPGIIEYSNLRPMAAAYVYVPFYMPHNHPNWQASDDELLDKARHYLVAINAEAATTEQAARLFRYEYAQPVCTPGFRHLLPPYTTGIPGLVIADTSHSFPEDRSIQESVRIGKELAEAITKPS